jgi:phosphoglycerate kinase
MPITFVGECIGPDAEKAVMQLNDSEIALLDNLRFHSAETIKDKNAKDDAGLRKEKEDFARQLANLADVYVNDAFGTCHRDNASMLTVPKLMEGKPRVVGYLVRRELEFLGSAITDPARPFVCVLGGAKVSDKLGVIQSLLTKCDTILIGGAMAFTFLKADGVEVGKSLVEPELLDTARDLRAQAGDKLRLPIDSVVAAQIEENATTEICEGPIPAGKMGLDIGPRTVAGYKDMISTAKTVVWNGPMGVFETKPFDAGTMAMAKAVAAATDAGATTVIGGGDSAAAIDRAGLADKMTHISTGGGASLEFLEGKPFAAIEVLDDA